MNPRNNFVIIVSIHVTIVLHPAVIHVTKMLTLGIGHVAPRPESRCVSFQ